MSKTNLQTGRLEPSYRASLGKHIQMADQQDIVVCLREIIHLLKIQPDKYPDKDKIEKTIDFLRQNYGTFTLDELNLAFRYVLTGRIEVEHYTSFTAEYICQVLNQYNRKYRAEVKMEIAKQISEPKKLEAAQYTIEQLIERIKKQDPNARTFYGKSKEIFQYLESEGEINLTIGEKEIKFAEVMSYMVGMEKAKNPFMMIDIIKANKKKLVQINCWNFYLNKYFDEIKTD